MTHILGEIKTTKTEDGKLTCLKWQDKRQVTMLSSFHNNEAIEKKRRTRKADGGTEMVKKPKMVEDYNKYMGGVDRNDQMIKYYTYSHRLVITILLIFDIVLHVGQRNGGEDCFSMHWN